MEVFFKKNKDICFFQRNGADLVSWDQKEILTEASQSSKTIVQAYLPVTSGSLDVTLTVEIPPRVATEHPKA